LQNQRWLIKLVVVILKISSRNKRAFNMQKKVNTDLGGKPFSFETGTLAMQSNGAVVGQLGDTVVLATAVMSSETRPGMNFFPLMVDYEEKLYAVGKIKGSRFIKREGRPTDEAVLSGRVIDRALRPLFPDGMRNDVQVILSILSVDEVNDPDIIGMNAASAALTISNIPFDGPLAGVRIGRLDGKFIVSPTYEEREKGDLDIIVAGTREHIMMVEAGSKIVPEKYIIEAVRLAQTEITKLVDLQLKFKDEVGGQEKAEVVIFKPEQNIVDEVFKLVSGKFEKALFIADKAERGKAVKEIEKTVIEQLENDGIKAAGSEDTSEMKRQAGEAMYKLQKAIVRKGILEQGKRIDGRAMDVTRPISAFASVLPRTHGSALFNRGETQALTIVTLGSTGDAQILDGMENFEEVKKRYIHHYNMPGFSVGEVRPLRGAGRREIGHGALAERAIEPVLPSKEKFPYTMRLVSEVLSSNGSTSMASTCGSSLSLMDAGVPISAQVGGVAMGLVLDTETGNYKVLTDIQGTEDFFGDMDFKVAGPREGVTALQMDVKTKGLTADILEKALEQAHAGRMHIIDAMDKVLDKPRPELSKYAPRIEAFMIDPKKIREVIGSGGKIINEIIEKTGVDIDIEDDGQVAVTSKDPEGMKKAVEWIKNLVREIEVGEVFDGKVVRIMDFGAFVELLPGKDGMVHISKLAPTRIARVEDVVNIGDTIKVKVDEIDAMGRINLVKLDDAGKPVASGGGDRGGFGGGPRRGPGGPRRGGPPRGGNRRF